MKILVINSGSSSLQYQIIDTNGEKCLVRGLVDKIGVVDSSIKQKRFDGEEIVINKEIISHTKAIAEMHSLVLDKKYGVLMSINEIDAVGHRVVHGGEKFYESALIDEKAIKIIERYSSLAPLHNPPNLVGIREAMSHFPNSKHIAVFDTSFHNTI
ncbi:acetate kinase, partial [candidate division WOR-3 bacterium]|nr:acetate kinase [candidate division WOR-3 bacterium]